MPSELAELKWLGRQREPVWGGHLLRGHPITDPKMKKWVDDGLIRAVENPSVGYVLTDKGREYICQRQPRRRGLPP